MNKHTTQLKEHYMSNVAREYTSKNELDFYQYKLGRTPNLWRSHSSVGGIKDVFASIKRKQKKINDLSNKYSFLPWNLHTRGNTYATSLDGVDQEYSRFIGFFEAIIENGYARKLLAASLSKNGVNSPYTLINPYELARRYRSPGRFLRRMFAIRERANVILRPYRVHVSWRALAIALCYGPFKTGKAATVAAANTLARAEFKTYKEARLELERMSSKGGEDGEVITVFMESIFQDVPFKAYYSREYGKKRVKGIIFYIEEYKEYIDISPYSSSLEEELSYAILCYENDLAYRASLTEKALKYSSELLEGWNFSPVVCYTYPCVHKHAYEGGWNDFLMYDLGGKGMIAVSRLAQSYIIGSGIIGSGAANHKKSLRTVINSSLVEAKEWERKIEEEENNKLVPIPWAA
jgi:hypothetical protein